MKLWLLCIRRNLIAFMLCIGLMQVAGYYLAATTAHPAGGVAVAQPDTLLYCQAARRIVEGHPFSFAEGSAVSTGTTSVFYPFVLAAFQWCGAYGDALLTTGFWLNAFFYLVFLVGWGMAFWRWLDTLAVRWTAAILLAFSAQPAFCSMAQSDIGFWLATSALMAAGLAFRKPLVYGILLALCPWIRPEGMVYVVAFGVVYLSALVLRGRLKSSRALFFSPRRDGMILLVAVASVVGVFVLNFVLTGRPQFSSVANKGYFGSHPFAAAVGLTAGDFLRIVKCYLFGLVPVSSSRDLITLPVLSGLFIWVGVFRHEWKAGRTAEFAVLGLAVAGGVATVAQSGWQDTNFDRYLVWTTPFLLMFLSEGVVAFSGFFRRRGCIRRLPMALCLVFSVCTSVVAIFSFHQSSVATDRMRQFGHEVDANIPGTASVGSFGACGMAYELGHRPYKHLWGIYSPEFMVKSEVASLETLKNRPQTRFDYWFMTPSVSATVFKTHVGECCGETVMTGPDGFEIRKADWRIFDYAAESHVVGGVDGELVCRVDVGDEMDEQSADYEVIDRYGRRPEPPSLIVDNLEGGRVADGGRLIVGGDAMTVPLKPGRDAVVVMRTYPKWTSVRTDAAGRNSSDYAFANPLTMNVAVNGNLSHSVSVPYATNGFSDVSFRIPGAAIRSTPCRLEFLGDHVACGYWFYQ